MGMNLPALNKREAKVYLAMLEQRNRVWTVDDLAELMYQDSRPKEWRQSVMQRMRMIMLKLQALPLSFIIVRSSALGRSNKALYHIEIRNRRTI